MISSPGHREFPRLCRRAGQGEAQSMGVFVTLFLLVFFVFAYLLKKEYWKDVH
jgi:cytochrome c1